MRSQRLFGIKVIVLIALVVSIFGVATPSYAQQRYGCGWIQGYDEWGPSHWWDGYWKPLLAGQAAEGVYCPSRKHTGLTIYGLKIYIIDDEGPVEQDIIMEDNFDGEFGWNMHLNIKVFVPKGTLKESIIWFNPAYHIPFVFGTDNCYHETTYVYAASKKHVTITPDDPSHFQNIFGAGEYDYNAIASISAVCNPGYSISSVIENGVEKISAPVKEYNETITLRDDIQINLQSKTDLELSVTARPETLWIDSNGAGSGIVFQAKASVQVPITFKIRDLNGAVFDLGVDNAEGAGTDYFADYSWWGNCPAGIASAGTYHVICEAEGVVSKTSFTVVSVSGSALGMGDWVKGKDPAAVVPPSPSVSPCDAYSWDSLSGMGDGYFSNLSLNDPVNIVSGDLIVPQVDLKLKSNRSLVLARIYNSLDPNIGSFGRGWSSPYISRLELNGDKVLFVNSDGSRILFTKQGNDYLPIKGIDLKLTLNSDTGFWTIFHPHGDQWTFDSSGKILRMSKACCGAGVTDTLEFTYDTAGKLSKVTNPAGQCLEFTFTDDRVTGIADSSGRTLGYSYDTTGNLVLFTDVLGRTTTYNYNDDGFLTRITRPGNRITAVAYTDRHVASVTAPDGAVSLFNWDFSTPKLTVTDANGVNHEYGFTSSWRLNSYSVPSLNLTKTFNSSEFALTGLTDSLGNSFSYTYGTDGLLQTITDPMGNASSYEWHPDCHRLTRKTDSLGREWKYSWCYRGNLMKETDPAGGVSSYTYDTHNNRTSKTDTLGRVTHWIYDNSGNYLVQNINPEGGISSFSYDNRGNLVSSSDPLGRATQFEYDILDRLTRTIYPDGRFTEVEYDEAGNVFVRRTVGAPLAAPLGMPDAVSMVPPRETHYAYDLADRLTTLTRPDGTTFNYAYNAAGQKISETDSLGRITRFEYNPIGLLTKTIYPDGAEETFAYDTESRLISKTNELGQTTNLEYDAMGRLLATIDPTGARWESQYDAVGRKIADKDPLNRVTSYQFDVLDRITKVTRPDGSFVSNSFDAVGNLLSTVDALGKVWSWNYDNLNRQGKAFQPNGASSTTVFDAAGQVIAETDALNRTTQYTFDNGGRRTATTDALGNVWQNIYDNAGRLIAVQDPMGAVSSMTYDIMDRMVSQSDPLGNVTSFEFDAAGRRIAKIDAMGRRSITTYNLRDRVMSEVDPEGHTVSYGYNLAGQKVSLTDAANRTWRWDFDSLGRITSEVDPLGNTNRYAFDSVGNRVSWTNARNQTTAYTFNSMNRLSQISYPDATLATMAYDLEGREISRSGPAGMVTKTYDSVGNMTSEAFSVGALLAAPKKWQYSFDPTGNRIGAIDPEGKIFKYQFDNLNRMIQMGVREASTPRFSDEIKFSFDPAGRLIEEIRPGVKTTNTFDLAGRLLQLKHERDHGHEKIVALRRYTYSSVGNRLSMLDEGNGLTRYFYNGSDWLTKAAYPDGRQVSYGYNGAGDRIEEQIETPTVKGHGRHAVIGTDTVTIPLSYDAGGKLISRASDTFAFDPDGNQISAVENGDESRYFWTPDNHLTRIEKDIECPKHSHKRCRQCPQIFTMAEEYSYLPESWKRITRKTGDQTFVSIYDGDDEALEYQLKTHKDKREHDCACRCGDHRKPHLNLIREFIGGPGTDDLLATRYHGRNLWHLTDALGSIIGLTNRGGNVVSKIGYDVFGNLKFPDKPGFGLPPLKESDLDDYLDRCDAGRAFENSGIDPYHLGRHHGRVISPYLFTGRRLDGFSGQYFNRARYYQPKYGRFSSADPISFLAGPNRFLYCDNNPLLYTDPFGLEVVAIFDKAAGTLTVTDQQTKQTVSIQNVFSGQTGAQEWQKNVGPIPNGPYIIGLGFNAKPGSTGDYQWYPVFGLDSSMDPRQRPAVTVKDPSGKDISRGGFFIHTGSVSLGCVTIKSDVECGPDYPKSSGYDQLKTLVDKTKPLEFKDGKFSGWLYVK